MKFTKQEIEIILKQIRGVTESLRQSLFWSSLFTNKYVKGNDADFTVENDAILGMKKITLILSNNFNKEPDLTALDIITPFLGLISCSKVNGPIVNSILDALSVLITFKVLKPELEDISEAVNHMVDEVAQCKFDASNKVDDERVLMKIIKFLKSCYASDIGNCLQDERVWQIINTILIGTYDVGYSTFLRSFSEEELKDVIHILYDRILSSYTALMADKDRTINVYGITKKVHFDLEIETEHLHGFQCGLKTLNYIIFRINPDAVGCGISDDSIMNVRLLCLQLLSYILTQCKHLFFTNQEYRDLLLENLPFYLIKIYQNNCSSILFYHALRNIYVLCVEYRGLLRYQIEQFFVHIFLKVLKSTERSVQLTTTLDVLFDLFSDDTFLIDLYVNYDCNPKRYSLCEMLYECLSQRVVNKHPQADYALSIMNRGLEYIFQRCHSLHKPFAEGTDNNNNVITIQSLIDKKNDRNTLQKGISLFNSNPKIGLQFFQDTKIISTPPSAKEIAELFRFTLGLDKKLIGAYIGTAVNQEVLIEYVKTFDFHNQKLLDSLRMFLECFRLPGEAQQIDAIVQAFSNVVYTTCYERDTMAGPDVTYCLTFAIIMLNTDLHNPSMKPERRMKKVDFVRLNTSYDPEVSKGKDLPPDFLEEIYRSIACDQICTSDTTTDEFRSESYRDQVRTIHLNPKSGCMQLMENEPIPFISIYDHEIVTSLWKIFDTTYFSVIEETDIFYTLCETGLSMLYQIGTVYKLYGHIDTIMTRLCEQTSLLQPLDNPTFSSSYIQRVLEFGGHQKSMNSLKLLFTLIGLTCNAIEAGWNWIVHILCVIYRVGLLPKSLFRVKYDLLMDDERKQFNIILDDNAEPQYNGFFSYIFGEYNMSSRDFFEDPILVKWEENSLVDVEVVKLFLVERYLENCHMENVIPSFVNIDDNCIDFLINALKMEIGLDNRSPDGLRKLSSHSFSIYTIPSTPYFGVLLFSEVICNSSSSFDSLIPAFRDSIIIVLSNTVKLNNTLEVIVESILTVTYTLLYKFDSLSMAYTLYELLPQIDGEICSKLAIQISRGLARVVKTPSFRLCSEAEITPILTLLEKTSTNPPATRQCFDIVSEMLCYEYKDINVYGPIIELMNFYYRLQGLSVDLIAESIGSIIAIENFLLQLLTTDEKDIALPLINSFLNTICISGRDCRLIIKQLSLKAFSKILCSAPIKNISIVLYTEIIQILLIPLLNDIVTNTAPANRLIHDPESTSITEVDANQLCYTCSKLVLSVFCYRFSDIILSPGFRDVINDILKWYHLLNRIHHANQDLDTYIEQSYTTICTIIIDCKLLSDEERNSLIEFITKDKLAMDDEGKPPSRKTSELSNPPSQTVSDQSTVTSTPPISEISSQIPNEQPITETKQPVTKQPTEETEPNPPIIEKPPKEYEIIYPTTKDNLSLVTPITKPGTNSIDICIAKPIKIPEPRPPKLLGPVESP